MPEERHEERTETATPRRREEARQRGHVARSLDLSSALILLAALLALHFFGRSFIGGIFGSLRAILENLHTIGQDPGDLAGQYGAYVVAVAVGMLPFLAVILVAALASGFIQVGFLFTFEPLALNLERLDPIAGLQRIFSLRGLVRLAAGLLKLLVLTAVVAFTIWDERASLMALMDRDFPSVVQFILEIAFVLSLRAVLALLVLAILDYAYQRYQYEADIRMSRQEIREELKRYEGDPKIRERRRAIQRQIALQRMMQRVPKATVVITNPTEYAVAIEYQRERMQAPIVVAKGVDFLAQRIREVAMEHGVPIVARPEVARALYKSVEVGQPIPYELYQAVAEILAYVYRLKGLPVAG